MFIYAVIFFLFLPTVGIKWCDDSHTDDSQFWVGFFLYHKTEAAKLDTTTIINFYY